MTRCRRVRAALRRRDAEGALAGGDTAKRDARLAGVDVCVGVEAGLARVPGRARPSRAAAPSPRRCRRRRSWRCGATCARCCSASRSPPGSRSPRDRAAQRRAAPRRVRQGAALQRLPRRARSAVGFASRGRRAPLLRRAQRRARRSGAMNSPSASTNAPKPRGQHRMRTSISTDSAICRYARARSSTPG